MKNADFKKLVALLKADPDLLHDLVVNGGKDARIDALLDQADRMFVRNSDAAAKLDNVLLHGVREGLAAADAIAACVDSCEASQGTVAAGLNPAFDALHPGAEPGQCTYTCSCSSGSCGNTCAVTKEVDHCADTVTAELLDQGLAINPGHLAGGVGMVDIGGLHAGCGADVTCSCTDGTCGGATCGGSTCSVTCSGDSCGNTCGNSCEMTTNLTRDFGSRVNPVHQVARWR